MKQPFAKTDSFQFVELKHDRLLQLLLCNFKRMDLLRFVERFCQEIKLFDKTASAVY
jgi:hypothetical protein